jgi:hypothetical protein
MRMTRFTVELLPFEHERHEVSATKLQATLPCHTVALMMRCAVLCGAQFTFVDCALLPFFLRLAVLSHYRGFHVPQVSLQALALAAAPRDHADQQQCSLCTFVPGLSAPGASACRVPLSSACPGTRLFQLALVPSVLL